MNILLVKRINAKCDCKAHQVVPVLEGQVENDSQYLPPSL